ncbi:hypothetical protein P615_15870 [Brevibacillus laterosporus PE36]|nr:hypothetical protein P615_15870 [Brevibacillus laterosporus PE36]
MRFILSFHSCLLLTLYGDIMALNGALVKRKSLRKILLSLLFKMKQKSYRENKFFTKKTYSKTIWNKPSKIDQVMSKNTLHFH